MGDSSIIFKIYIHPFKLREMENSKIEVKEEKEKKVITGQRSFLLIVGSKQICNE